MNKLSKLCKEQGWTKEDVARLLGITPEYANKLMLKNNAKNIPENDFLLLRYMAKYGEME